MPKINVYLSDELAAAVKEAGIPVSPVCQHALEQAVRKIAAAREMVKVNFTDEDDPMARLTNLTTKAHRAIAEAARRAGERGQDQVGTEYLLAGVLGIGDNMALNVLRSMDIQPDDVRDDLFTRLPAAQPAPDPGEPKRLHMSPESGAVLKQAFRDAISLGHNYIGCEHLLLALVADTDGLGGEVLRSHGAEPRLVRRAVQAALSGFTYARSQAPAAAPRGDAAERLRATLVSFGERLDRIEARLADLPGGG
ncbi:MAG TPA: Clp protease N-terminal domain-containing protein [Pseudonocardiaceae bacterium]|nr:Clp protease N-terminal domain-containing protein [Pseudonocardiaceae bacterium]